MSSLRSTISLLLAFGLLAACKGGGTGSDPVIRVDVTGPSATVQIAETLQLSAAAFTADGPATGKTPSWSSSDAAVARVSATGLVTGVSAGAAVITATVDGVAGQMAVTVTRAPVLSLDMDGFVERGATVHLRVTRAGTPVPSDQWQLAVTPAGALTALGGDSARLNVTGNVTVVIDAGDATGSRIFNVAAPPVVFFDRVADSNRDIYRVDLDGQNLTRITTDPGTDQDPTVAAGRVVFVSFRAGTADLWSVAATGGANTRLTTASGNETTPALTRDGLRLAYAWDGQLVSKLWTASGDGTGAARATTGFGFNGSIESSPAWAPSGTRLAFMSTAAGSADLYDFTPGTGTPALVAPSEEADVEPAWSPDGQRVAFVSTRHGSDVSDLYLLHVATGEVTRLTSTAQNEGRPTWTPDGLRLVYTDFGGGTLRLAWLEVARPGTTHLIPTGEGRADNPAVEP